MFNGSFHITRFVLNIPEIVPCKFMPCHGCKFKVMNGFLRVFLYAISLIIRPTYLIMSDTRPELGCPSPEFERLIHILLQTKVSIGI